MTPGRTRAPATWLAVGASLLAVGEALSVFGLPSPALFGALLVGVAWALALPGRLRPPRSVFLGAQAITGVIVGTYLQPSALRAVAGSWPAVVGVGAGTLIVSLLGGVALSRMTVLDMPTASLGMVAGGASGIVSMAGDLEADDRLVAFMQYLRVLVVVLVTPVMTTLAFPVHHAAHGAGQGSGPVLGDVKGWLLTLALAPLGAWLARLARLPTTTLLGPLILSAVVTLAVPGGTFAVPPILRTLAFAAIGLQVGLRFTVATIREVGRLLPVVLGFLFLLLAACFGLALVLDATTPLSLLDAYLATTPGGLYAVLAIALGAGANSTFIVANQALRMVVMMAFAPIAVRWLVRAAPRPDARSRPPSAAVPVRRRWRTGGR